MNKRLKNYSEYQRSGFDWLGRIPKSWKVRRLGNYFRERREKVSDADYQPLSVTMHGIVPQLENAAKTNDGDNRKLVRKGDFAINSRSDRKGSSGVSPYDGSVSLITIVAEPIGLYPEFVHHLLRCEAFQEEFYRFGKGIVADLWSTNYDAMKNITIPVMSLDEQTQIAAFLDYETAKIDTLIEKQQELIALLAEKRQAVISHAVTKGLNADAPMRGSGVEWLGDVPEHWKLSKLKWYCVSIRDGTHNPPPRAEGIHRLLSVRNIVNSQFVLRNDDRTMTPEAFRELQRSYTVDKGDVLLAIVGGTTGKSAVAPYLENVTVQRSLAIIRAKQERLSPHFLNFWLGSGWAQARIHMVATKYAAQPGIYLEDVGGLYSPVPPAAEQEQIVQHLNARTEKLDSLIDKSEEASKVLQERRTALISAAVTGKIDVRGWKRPPSQVDRELEMEVA